MRVGRGWKGHLKEYILWLTTSTARHPARHTPSWVVYLSILRCLKALRTLQELGTEAVMSWRVHMVAEREVAVCPLIG
jgi:hypothetical protein